MTNEELLSEIPSYVNLISLLNISKSQANRIFNRICPLNDTQRELLMIKLGLVDNYVDKVYLHLDTGGEVEFFVSNIESVGDHVTGEGVFELETCLNEKFTIRDDSGTKRTRLLKILNDYDCIGVVL